METKTIKTNIVGFILIIMGSLALAIFVISIIAGGLINIINNPIVFLYLIVGVYSIVEGSAIRGHKKWAWYVGIVTFGAGFIGNLITIFFLFSPQLLVALLLGGFILYTLISEKKGFFPKLIK